MRRQKKLIFDNRASNFWHCSLLLINEKVREMKINKIEKKNKEKKIFLLVTVVRFSTYFMNFQGHLRS